MKKHQNFQALVARSVMSLAIALLIVTKPASGAGVTILTHGFQPAQQKVIWLDSMESVVQSQWIDALSPAPEGNTGLIMFDEMDGNFFPSIKAWPTAIGGSNAAEITVVLNWSAVAGIFSPIVETRSDSTSDQSERLFSTTEVANSIVNLFTQPQLGLPPLVQLPVHLVGHSRGGSLVSELARLFGERGIWIDQMTTLDPHPLILIDADPIVYENVLFADNYYQDNFNIFVPDGRPIAGAYNRLLGQTVLAAGGYPNQHSDIHLWYHGTVDNRYTVEVSDGEAALTESLRSVWYDSNEFRGTMTGYRLSRLAESFDGSIRNSNFTPVAGGGSVRSGYSNLVGGIGTRWAINKSAAVWPNLITVDILRDGVALEAGDWYVAVGDSLRLQFQYVSYNSSWSADFFIDSDMNPYNGFASPSPIISSDVRPGSNFPVGLAGPLNTSVIAPNDGGYYFCGRISDATGQHVRYLYAKPKVIFFERPAMPTDTIIATDTYIDASAPNAQRCRDFTLLAGSGRGKFTFIQFDVAGLSKKVVSARLHLWVEDHIPAPVALSLHRVIGETPWSECQVNTLFNARFLVQGFASRAFSGSGWHELDVTTQIQDWADGTIPNNGFLITDDPNTTGGYVVFGSAESAHPPFLEINTTSSCCDTPGDANNDAKVNIADVSFLISWLFAGGGSPACCAEGSANGDGKINIGDVTYIISWLFSGGPFPVCGPSTFGC